ncbi:MAG: PQQ-binding-like beta-propeller repeat protein [Planctomycetota bacterium]
MRPLPMLRRYFRSIAAGLAPSKAPHRLLMHGSSTSGRSTCGSSTSGQLDSRPFMGYLLTGFLWAGCLLMGNLLTGCGEKSPSAGTTATSTATNTVSPSVSSSDSPTKPTSADSSSAPSPTAGVASATPASPPSVDPVLAAELAAVPDLGTRKRGDDWPWFLGPTRNNKSTETGLATPWPKEGPRIVWQRPLGEGYGIGSVSLGRFLQFDREKDEAVLLCLNAETGEELWRFAYPTDYSDLYGYNGGPRASPVVDGDRVYIFGAEGWLHCLSLVDGKVRWKVNTSRDFSVVQNFFGVGSTPVIEGDLLLAMVGGSPPEDQQIPPGQLDRVSGAGSGIVAFDKRTGEVRYKITDELASYASLQLATVGGRRWAFAFCRGGLIGFEPSTGKVDFDYPWRARTLESVNASTPVVIGDEVFISETYSIGSSLLKVATGRHEVVWSDSALSRDKSFKAHWNTPIFVGGYLYGCSGRNPPDADLRCIEWKSGKVQWTVPTKIRSSLLYVDGHFISMGEFGSLELIKVNPEKYELVSEVTYKRPGAEPLPPGLEDSNLLRAPCWAAPILSHGLLYVRGEDRLVCLEVISD